MSGRDVRRVAARASTSAHHEKQQQVTRLVLAAIAQGVEHIYLSQEPFRINERAVENLAERDRVTLLTFPLTHTAKDTETMVRLMWSHGVRTFIVLGGDGTSRIVSREFPKAAVMPLSTGTNNVFPFMIEASLAGTAAALIATNSVAKEPTLKRCKRIHIEGTNTTGDSVKDIALIDAVQLQHDSLGSLLPFEADHLRTLFLTRAEPASVGISPIGGYLMPCSHTDDFAVRVVCGKPANASVRVPISPGLWQTIAVQSFEKIALDQTFTLAGDGILAYDGDRTHDLTKLTTCEVTVRRDGPWIIDPHLILNTAAHQGILKHSTADLHS